VSDFVRVEIDFVEVVVDTTEIVVCTFAALTTPTDRVESIVPIHKTATARFKAFFIFTLPP
jgi:hypothetical protein